VNKSWYIDLVIDIDECSSQPCSHNGTCHDQINSYICSCLPGYTGKDCVISKLSSLLTNYISSHEIIYVIQHVIPTSVVKSFE
jgi:Notch-like protein